ncbi:PqqD family protein [Sphingobacterium kyonggiense]
MRIDENITVRKIAGEYLVLQPGLEMLDMAKVYTLSESAALILNNFKGIEFNREDALQVLLQHYQVGSDQAKDDLDRIINQFIAEGMIQE